jgi:hypothetical protein
MLVRARMDWYVVIKTIKGRRYRYRQKTWREHGRVRTRSEYTGPAGGSDVVDAVTTIAAQVQNELATEIGSQKEWELGWDSEGEVFDWVQNNAPIDALIATLPVEIKEDSFGARYSPIEDRITLPPREVFFGAWDESPSETYYSTALHELVHNADVRIMPCRCCQRAYEAPERDCQSA